MKKLFVIRKTTYKQFFPMPTVVDRIDVSYLRSAENQGSLGVDLDWTNDISEAYIFREDDPELKRLKPKDRDQFKYEIIEVEIKVK